MGSGQLLPSKTPLSPTIYFLFFKIFSKRARACILIITDPCLRVGDGGAWEGMSKKDINTLIELSRK